MHGVPLDVHAQDGGGVLPGLVVIVGQLDTARLAPSTHLHLGLHHHRAPQLLGRLAGLGDRGGHPALGNRDPVAREEGLALVLEEVHVAPIAPGRGGRPTR